MENTETTTKNDLANGSSANPKPRGKGGNTKVIICSIAGALVFLAVFFLVEKQTGLIGLFKNNDNSETQELLDSEVEEEELSIEDLETTEGEESKLKNTGELAFSGLSDDQYDLAVALMEDELVDREPESDYFFLDNTTLIYKTVQDAEHEYSIATFNIISSNKKKYEVVVDTGGSLSGFKEIKISEEQ